MAQPLPDKTAFYGFVKSLVEEYERVCNVNAQLSSASTSQDDNTQSAVARLDAIQSSDIILEESGSSSPREPSRKVVQIDNYKDGEAQLQAQLQLAAPVDVDDYEDDEKEKERTKKLSMTTVHSHGDVPGQSDSDVKQWGILSPEKEEDLLEVAEETATNLGIAKDDVINAWRCFSATDKDTTGCVGTVELHGLLEMLHGHKIDEFTVAGIMKKFDKDDDGELNFEEFLYCFCYTPEKRLDHLKAAVYRQDDRLDDKFRTRMVGVPAHDLKRYLQKEMAEEQAFLSIPVIFILFFFFILSSGLHHMTARTGAIENAIRFDIVENANFAFVGAAPFENGRMGHKNIDDVNSYEDFWSWLDLGLTPMFFPYGWLTSESRQNVAARCMAPLDAMKEYGWDTGGTTANTPYGANAAYAAITGDLGPNMCKLVEETAFPKELDHLKEFGNPTKKPYLFFNEIIAGMRLRQEQLPEVSCTNDDLRGHVFNTPCMDINRNHWLAPDLDTALQMEPDQLDKPGGKTVYLRSGSSMEKVHQQIRQLENSRWLNQQTGKIEILYTLYNNQVDTFVAVYINFFINRGGHIHKVVKPIAINMSPYENPWAYVTDGIFAFLVFKLFFSEVYQIFLSCKEHGLKQGMNEYFYDFKNIIDWLSLAYTGVIFVMWWQNCRLLADLSDLLMTANTSIPGSWAGDGDIFTPTKLDFWEAVDETTRYGQLFQVVLAFYPFFIGMRFLSAFAGQPRLGLVTTTLWAASNDLMHFGVVLCVTIMVFCSSAVILFGREVDEFENFGRTYISVVRAMLGDFDYAALTEVGRFPASIWWIIFMVAVNLVMVNMVLAIIMDVYGNVKAAMGDDVEDFPTIVGQSNEIYRRWYQKRQGLRMSIHDIVLALEKKEEECYVKSDKQDKPTPRLITVSTFCRLVAGLGKKQAERLLTGTADWLDFQATAGTTLDDCISRIRSVDLKVQQVQAVSELLEKANREELRLLGQRNADTHYRTQHLLEECQQTFHRAAGLFSGAVNSSATI